MPKLKTHSGASKRFKVTKNGKVKRSHAMMNHILTKKSTKFKRSQRGTTVAKPMDEKTLKKLLPYA